MKRLLYINNYNCSNKHSEISPDNHLWGADALSKVFDVTCAEVPGDNIKVNFKGAVILNNFIKSAKMLLRYFNYDIVYSACGDLTGAFALANILHIGKRRLYKIQHHGGKKISFAKGYTKIMFISPTVSSLYKLENQIDVNWGGQIGYAEKFIQTTGKYLYDFVSAGKSGRDHDCMIAAANEIECKTLIISAVNDTSYDKEKIIVLSGNDRQQNSTSYSDTYTAYAQSRFIVIPIMKRTQKNAKALAGLTTFVDAVVMKKPVLISDSTNMGADVETLGIGLVYKAGDPNDMRVKMEQMLAWTADEYDKSCRKMEEYSRTHNYDEFCKEILNIVK